jgi:hypothetical protein
MLGHILKKKLLKINMGSYGTKTSKINQDFEILKPPKKVCDLSYSSTNAQKTRQIYTMKKYRS